MGSISRECLAARQAVANAATSGKTDISTAIILLLRASLAEMTEGGGAATGGGGGTQAYAAIMHLRLLKMIRFHIGVFERQRITAFLHELKGLYERSARPEPADLDELINLYQAIQPYVLAAPEERSVAAE